MRIITVSNIYVFFDEVDADQLALRLGVKHLHDTHLLDAALKVVPRRDTAKLIRVKKTTEGYLVKIQTNSVKDVCVDVGNALGERGRDAKSNPLEPGAGVQP